MVGQQTQQLQEGGFKKSVQTKNEWLINGPPFRLFKYNRLLAECSQQNTANSNSGVGGMRGGGDGRENKGRWMIRKKEKWEFPLSLQRC